MRLRRFLCVLLSLVMTSLLFSLAGCGSQTTPKKDTTADEETSGAYAGIEEYVGTTVKFATWVDHTQGEGANAIESFFDKYGINIELVAAPQGSYVNKISGLIAAGQAPDIIVDNDEFPNLFSSAQDLKQIKSLNLDDDFWDASVTKMGSIGDAAYFVNSKNSPWTYRWIVFYNKKIFEDNGFTSPGEYYEDGNWTIDTFKECAKRVHNLGGNYIGASVRPYFAASIWETGLLYYDYNTSKLATGINDSKLNTALKWCLDGVESGIFMKETAVVQFSKNQVGMILYGDFGLRASGGLKNMDADLIGFVPLPKVSKNDEYYPSAGSWRAYGICKGAKNPEAAGYFLRYFLDFKNYDRDTMFKNEEASEFYDELRKIEDHCFMIPSDDYSLYDGISSSSAQVDANLFMIKNEVEAEINKMNKLLVE